MKAEVYAARILRYTDPGRYEEFVRKASPMLNAKHVGRVKQIYDNTVSLYASTLPKQEVNDIFIGATYSVFCPVSFIPAHKTDGKDATAVGKLPVGVRDIMAECIGLKHAEEVNRLKSYISSWLRPFYTGPKRPFELKVDAVVDTMRPYSINQWDHQYEMAI
jgi:hypothetical protein